MLQKAVLMLLCPLLFAGCGSDDPTAPEAGRNDVVFTRANGTAITFAPTVQVWCGAWEDGEVTAPSVHVLVGNAAGGWLLRAVRADVQIGKPLAFPNSYIWDQPQRADLFVFDPPNELSTQADDSSGSITFQKLDCGSNGGVRFTIDAVVGSEYGDLPSVTVKGSFESALTR